MRKSLRGFIALAGLILASAASAETGYLTIKGQKTGEIKGEVTSKGHEGTSDVVALEYSAGGAPISSSGLATGRRAQQPISFTLHWTKATPLLLKALTENEVLSQVRYQGFAPKPDGTTANVHEITLTDARISSLKLIDKNGNEPMVDPLVVITLTYKKIELMHVEGGITAEDDWSAVN